MRKSKEMIPKSGSAIPNSESSADFYLSANITQQDLDLGLKTLIDVYDDRVKEWFIEPCKSLFHDQNSGFAILSIVFSYFESFSIVQSRTGSSSSRAKFTAAFKEIFQDSIIHTDVDEIVALAWKKIRNGLYHLMITKRDIIINHNLIVPFEIKKSKRKYLELNPVNIVKAIENHHNEFMSGLRSNITLKNDFERHYLTLQLER